MSTPSLHPRPPATFHTARLEARTPRREDAPAAFANYASDSVVTRYLAWPCYRHPAPLGDYLAMRAEQWMEGSLEYTWMLFLRGTDKLIGSISLNYDGPGVAFGYVLGQAYWGQGYTTEALRHLVIWAQAQPAIYRAWALCDVENPASARVMVKAGLSYEATLRRWHVCPNLGPAPRDALVHAWVR